MQQEVFGVALVGCGVVGGGTAEILLQAAEAIQRKTGQKIVLKYVVDIRFDHAKKIGVPEALHCTDFKKALADPEVKLVVELVGGLTFAKSIFEQALNAGKHVVTANKALMATHGAELFSLARNKGLAIGFEASCAGGIPIIRTLTEDLLANKIDALYGILNGTCNYILTQMTKQGWSYDEALVQAKALGYAEADPTLDVSGMDSAHKLTIMASLIFEKTFSLDSLTVQGLQNLDLKDVSLGKHLGLTLKLIAAAERTELGFALRVQPTFLPDSHPLANIWGSFNGVSVYGHAVGHTLYYGRGAGASPTASAVTGDIIGIATGILTKAQSEFTFWPGLTPTAQGLTSDDLVSSFYLRRDYETTAPVNAVAETLIRAGVAIRSVRAFSEEAGGSVTVLTAPVSTQVLKKALEALDKGPGLGTTKYLSVLEERKEFI